MKVVKTVRTDQATRQQFQCYRTIVSHLWELDHMGMRELATTAGVSEATLYNWRGGKVYAPRLNTLTAVALALGYDIVLRKHRKLKVV